MKLTLLLFISFYSLTSFAEGTSPVKENKTIETLSTADSTLNKLLKIDGVDKIYEKCKADPSYKTGSDLDMGKVTECLWRDVQADPKLKKLVLDEYEKNSKSDTGKIDLTSNSSIVKSTFDSQNNKGFQALQDTVGKKLKEALFGTNNDPLAIKTTDHAKFHEIYKDEITKSIIDVTTSFCMGLDFTSSSVESSCTQKVSLVKNCSAITDQKQKKECDDSVNSECTFYKYSENNKSSNSQQIQNGDLEQMITDSSGKQIKKGDSLIVNCISSISNMCAYATQGGKNEACIVADSIKAARKNLVLNDQIQKFYQTDAVVSNFQKADVLKERTKEVTNQDIAKAITVTSTDVENAYKKPNEELAQQATECANNPAQPNCEKFLNKDAKTEQDAIAEFSLRQSAIEEKLTEAFNTKNKDLIQEYLGKIGYSEDEIKKILANENSLANIKVLIKDKFDSQKKALVEELSARMNKTSTETNGQTADDKVKYGTVANSLSKKTKDLQDTVRFNNIASSYLMIDSSGGRKPSSDSEKRNTASLSLEVKSDKDKKMKVFETVVKDSKNSDDSAASLSLKNINDILGLGF